MIMEKAFLKERFDNHIKRFVEKDLTMQFNGIHVLDSTYKVDEFSIIYAVRAMIRIFMRFNTKQQKMDHSSKSFSVALHISEKEQKLKPKNQYPNGNWK